MQHDFLEEEAKAKVRERSPYCNAYCFRLPRKKRRKVERWARACSISSYSKRKAFKCLHKAPATMIGI